MSSDPYATALAESARLKLRATALLAEGGEDAGYEAAVLFHAAAGAEARALAALPAPSAETRLRSAVERCGCLVEARDPSAVIEIAWPEVLESSDLLPADRARALRARLDRRVTALRREYRDATAGSEALRAAISGAALRLPSKRVARQLEALLRQFPGDPRLWTLKGLWAVEQGDPAAALECVRRAQRLLLDEPGARGIELLAPGIAVILSARLLAPAEAEAALEAAFARIRFGAPTTELCFAFVSAGLLLAGRAKGRCQRLWERIADVASIGGALPPFQRDDQRFFSAARRLAAEVLAGRRPDPEILDRAGLGAAVAQDGRRDPVAILGAEMMGRVLRPAA